jgi:hypothetical protein
MVGGIKFTPSISGFGLDETISMLGLSKIITSTTT